MKTTTLDSDAESTEIRRMKIASIKNPNPKTPPQYKYHAEYKVEIQLRAQHEIITGEVVFRAPANLTPRQVRARALKEIKMVAFTCTRELKPTKKK